MSNASIKLDMIDALFNRGEWIKKVNNVEYRTRCPYCGDSQKNFNTGHLYIRIDPEDNFPMVFNCFKCNECGVINRDFLSMMDIHDMELRAGVKKLNKTSDKIKATNFLSGLKLIINNFTIPEGINQDKLDYIEERIGYYLSDKEIKDLKIVFSLKDFLKHNKINYVTFDRNLVKMLERDYVGFLSHGASFILFRDITDKNQFPWIKYPITYDSRDSKCFYTITGEVDPYTEEAITINISEGVMDIVSAYTNLGYNQPNTLNIAVTGKRYDTIINYLIDLGLVGNNIKINIFADNDEDYNDNPNNRPTDIKYFRRVFKNYKHIFGSIHVYYNKKSKDIGVPKEKIVLVKHKL